jgi:CRISPR-associated protein Csb2
VIARSLRENRDTPQPVSLISGHGSSGHRHAHYLPVADCATGAIAAINLWLPVGCKPADYAILVADYELYGIRGYDGRLQARPSGRLSFSAGQCWSTSTPFVLERHPKLRGQGAQRLKDGPADQLAQALTRRGFAAAEIELWEHGRGIPFASGTIGLEEFASQRRGAGPRSALYGATLRFGELVTGPIVLGRLAHFGLGQFGRQSEPPAPLGLPEGRASSSAGSGVFCPDPLDPDRDSVFHASRLPRRP